MDEFVRDTETGALLSSNEAKYLAEQKRKQAQKEKQTLENRLLTIERMIGNIDRRLREIEESDKNKKKKG